MSFVQKIINNLANIDQYLDKYNKQIDTHKDFFLVEGANLEFVCKRLPFIVAEFKASLAEIKSISDILEFRKETTEGEIWKKYIEGSKRHMAPKDIQMYTKQDESFILINEAILEIAFVKNKIVAILEALEVLHWQLNNIVKIRIASLEEVVL